MVYGTDVNPDELDHLKKELFTLIKERDLSFDEPRFFNTENSCSNDRCEFCKYLQ